MGGFTIEAPGSQAGFTIEPPERGQSWGERHPLAREATLGALSSASGLPEDIRAYEPQPRPSIVESVKEGIEAGFPVIGALKGAARAGRGLYEAGKALIPTNAMADPEAAAHGLGTVAGTAALAAAPESEAVGRTASRGAGRAIESTGRWAQEPIVLSTKTGRVLRLPYIGEASPATAVGGLSGLAAGHTVAGWPGGIAGAGLGATFGTRLAEGVESAGRSLRRLGEPQVAAMPAVEPPFFRGPQPSYPPGGGPGTRGWGVIPEWPSAAPETRPNVATTFERPTLSLPPAGDIQVAGIPEQRALTPAPFLVTPETRSQLALPPAPAEPPEAPVVRGGVPLSTTPVAVERGEFNSGEAQPPGLGYGLNGPEWFEQGGSGRARGLGGPARVAVTPPEALEQNPALVVGRGGENKPMSNTLRTQRIAAGLPPDEPTEPIVRAATEEREEDLTEKLKASLPLYHGTSASKFTRFNDKPAFLTDDPSEARAYAYNPIIGGGGGKGNPRVLTVTRTPGPSKYIGNEVTEGIMNDDEDVIERELEKAKKEGYRYATFDHPGTTDKDITVTVSLYPDKDLTIHRVKK